MRINAAPADQNKKQKERRRKKKKPLSCCRNNRWQLAHCGIWNQIQKARWTITLSMLSITCCYSMRQAITSQIETAFGDILQLVARIWELNHQNQRPVFFFLHEGGRWRRAVGCFVIHRLRFWYSERKLCIWSSHHSAVTTISPLFITQVFRPPGV